MKRTGIFLKTTTSDQRRSQLAFHDPSVRVDRNEKDIPIGETSLFKST